MSAAQAADTQRRRAGAPPRRRQAARGGVGVPRGAECCRLVIRHCRCAHCHEAVAFAWRLAASRHSSCSRGGGCQQRRRHGLAPQAGCRAAAAAAGGQPGLKSQAGGALHRLLAGLLVTRRLGGPSAIARLSRVTSDPSPCGCQLPCGASALYSKQLSVHTRSVSRAQPALRSLPALAHAQSRRRPPPPRQPGPVPRRPPRH